jgi:hypothetical protein
VPTSLPQIQAASIRCGRGITYVAVSEAEYGRFFLRNHKPSEKVQASYDRQKQFYERLFREGELLWDCKGGLLPILEPKILFYYLPPRSSGSRRTNLDIRNDFGTILDPPKTCCSCSVLPTTSNLRPLIWLDHLEIVL